MLYKDNKNDAAYERIKDEIINGIITNDSTLSENILVNRLNFSRTPIRAALLRLQMEGFVRIIPNQGIVVREVTFDEARDLYELRVLIEGFLTEQSFPLLLENDLSEMGAYVDKQEESYKQLDIRAYLDNDLQFHAVSYRRHHNEAMAKIFRNYRERLTLARLKVIRHNGRMSNGLKEHHEILDALKNGLIDEAIDLAKRHLNKGPYRAIMPE